MRWDLLILLAGIALLTATVPFGSEPQFLLALIAAGVVAYAVRWLPAFAARRSLLYVWAGVALWVAMIMTFGGWFVSQL